MKKEFFKGQQARIVSFFKAKHLHLGANLTEFSHSSEDLVRFVPGADLALLIRVGRYLAFSFQILRDY